MTHKINWKEIARTALVVGLLSCGAWACGDDTAEDDGTPAAGSSGSAAGSGGAGSGGAGAGGTSGGGAGGTSGAGGTAGMAAPVMCMGTMCSAVMSAQGMLPPCCDTDSGGGCGATVGMMGECEGIMQPGMDDPTCPDEMSVVGTAVPGCCKPDNKCGVMSATLMGCVERTDYPPTFLMGMMQLEAVDCGAGGGDDGGI